VFEKGKTYHIMEAPEWLGFLVFATALYSLLDWRIRSGRPIPSAPSKD
jgi:hypothetical protein